MPTFSPASLTAWSDSTTVDDTLMNAQIKTPIEDLRAQLSSRTVWTPVLTAATSNPTNYTGTGYYVKNGDVVTAWGQIATGASWTVGSGAYSLSLPVTADTTYGQTIIGVGYLFAGGSINTLAHAQQMTSTTMRLLYQSTLVTGTSAIAHNTPAAWPVSQANAMRWQITYLAA